MTTISVAPAAFAPRTAALISSRVELAPFLVERLAARRLLPLHDAGDALHVRDDVDAHASSLRRSRQGFRDKGVLVTGRIRRDRPACARAFAAEGARVLVHFHRGRSAREPCADELGGAPVAQADLTLEADVDRLFAEARDALGRSTSAPRYTVSGQARTTPCGNCPSHGGTRRCARTSRPRSSSRAGSCARSSARDTGHSSSSDRPQGYSASRVTHDYAAAKSGILGGLLLSLKNEVAGISRQRA